MNEQKNKNNWKITLASLLLGAALVLTGWATTLIGNQKQQKQIELGNLNLGRSCSTNNVASTSPVWLTPGTGTTTTNCAVFDREVLRVNAWLIASSTRTVYNFLISRSNDGKDYYEEAGEALQNLTSNSTSTVLVSNKLLSYVFASSTLETQISVGFNGYGTTSAKLISFGVLSRGANFVRIITSIPTSVDATTTGNGAFWMEGVPSNK